MGLGSLRKSTEKNSAYSLTKNAADMKKNSKKAKLKARELKKVEPYELQEINKKATNSWKLRKEIHDYNVDR